MQQSINQMYPPKTPEKKLGVDMCTIRSKHAYRGFVIFTLPFPFPIQNAPIILPSSVRSQIRSSNRKTVIFCSRYLQLNQIAVDVRCWRALLKLPCNYNFLISTKFFSWQLLLLLLLGEKKQFVRILNHFFQSASSSSSLRSGRRGVREFRERAL